VLLDDGYPTFWKVVEPASSRGQQRKKHVILLALLGTELEHTMTFRSVRTHKPKRTTSHPKILELSQIKVMEFACNETNLMHYLSSPYSVTTPLHVSVLLEAHHQEVTMYTGYFKKI
jgi:hypothetical protein